MPLLTAEAEKLSNDMLRQGVIENIVTADEVFALLPFLPMNGRAYRYNRENTLGDAEFVDTNDTINESAASTTEVIDKLKRIIGDVDVDDFLDATMSDSTDQAAVQISKKSKVVGRKFANALLNGDETANPKEFNGLRKLCVAGQKVNPSGIPGVSFAYDLLDELIDLVKIGATKIFIMNSRTIRAFFALTRALGGTDPVHITIPGITSQVPSYRGIPIMKNDWMPIDQGSNGVSESEASAWPTSTPVVLGQTVVPSTLDGNVYVCTTAGTTDASEPTWDTTEGNTTTETGGVVWTTYKAENTQIILAGLDEVEGIAGLMAQALAGINVKEVGTVQDKDATRYRVRWYAGLCMHSTLSLALANGVNN